MLSIDDPLWAELKHAYGVASDIPDQVARLTTSSQLPRKFWIDLWSSLCHQYTVYPASYAAFPHIVFAAPELSPNDRFEAMLLASGIAACSANGSRPRMPPRLAKPFTDAVTFGRHTLSAMVLENRKSSEKTLLFIAMIAAFDGQSKLTGSLWSVSNGFCCPACEFDFENPAEELSQF